MKPFAEAARNGPFAPRALIDYANKITLRKPNVEVLRPELVGRYPLLSHLLQDALKASENRKQLLLPNLRDFTNTIAIFSDYGGDNVRYKSYSFLFTDWHVVTGPFAEEVAALRLRMGLGSKEISYKDLRYGPIKRSLQSFLECADKIPGLLVTILIQKNINNLFGDCSEESEKTLREAMDLVGLSNLKRRIVQRLLTITHCSAFFTSLLSREGHKLFWMTDHDAICASDAIHSKMLDVFCRVLGLYADNRRYELVGGAVPFREKSVFTLDGLSITDLAAGASSDLLTQVDEVGFDQRRMKEGAEHLLIWLARHGLGLKKLIIVIKKHAVGVTSGIVTLTPKHLPDGVLVVPLFVP